MSPWIVVGIVAYWAALFFALALCRAAGRRTPAPPAGPRARAVLRRDRAGVVEILPSVGDAQNGSEWGQG
jgi:hypothetical protein